VRNTQRLRRFNAIIFCPKLDLGKAESGLLRSLRFTGSVPKLDRVISIEEMNTAIEAGATERFRR